MSLQAAGTLMMVYQVAASLSQLGFGRLADRGHARGAAGGRSARERRRAEPHRPGARSRRCSRSCWWSGGLGVAAFHPPGAMVAHTAGRRRARARRWRVFVTSGIDRLRARARCWWPMRRAVRAGRDAAGSCCRASPCVASSRARCRPCPCAAPASRVAAACAALRPQARNLFLLYTLVVLRTRRVAVVRDVRAGAADAAGHGCGRGGLGDGAVPLHVERHRRVLGRPARGSLRPAARHHASSLLLLDAVPARGAACCTGWAFAVAAGGRRASSCSPRCPVNVTLRPGTRAAQRRDRVVADDGRRLGHRRHARAGHRHARRRDSDYRATLTMLAACPWSPPRCPRSCPPRPPLPMHVEPVEVNVAAVDPSADDDA